MVGAPERRCEFERLTGNEINYDPHANAEEILSFMTSNGMIDLDGVAASMKKTEEERILNEHPYKITCGKDGRWRTYVKDETKKNGLKQIAKATEEKLKEAIVEHYRALDPEVQKDRMTLEELYPQWIEFKSLHTPAETYICFKQTNVFQQELFCANNPSLRKQETFKQTFNLSYLLPALSFQQTEQLWCSYPI